MGIRFFVLKLYVTKDYYTNLKYGMIDLFCFVANNEAGFILILAKERNYKSKHVRVRLLFTNARANVRFLQRGVTDTSHQKWQKKTC